MKLEMRGDMRLEQRMKLAPHLIQSMEILQLPILALQERIEQELNSNPVLEMVEPSNPEEAESKSIRGAFGRITTEGIYENVVHISATKEDTEHEIKLWFDPEQIEENIYPTREVVVENYTKKEWV